jgi:hypothetical protein
LIKLHIVQGGIANGDKKLLEKAARLKLSTSSWVVPKSVHVGDDVVIYVGSYGFFATAQVTSEPKPRRDWANRYGAGLTSIRLIRPAISLAAIRRAIPDLTWANFPRSITTPPPEVAAQIRNLIIKRKRLSRPDLDDAALEASNIDELRAAAMLKVRSAAEAKKGSAIYRGRSLAIRLYVLRRANGTCEGCNKPAPFSRPDGSAYLEPHHTTRLADDGPDHPKKVIGLCPNCHRRAHSAADAESFNFSLKKKMLQIEK